MADNTPTITTKNTTTTNATATSSPSAGTVTSSPPATAAPLTTTNTTASASSSSSLTIQSLETLTSIFNFPHGNNSGNGEYEKENFHQTFQYHFICHCFGNTSWIWEWTFIGCSWFDLRRIKRVMMIVMDGFL